MVIEGWEWDDGNLEELARHGLSRELVLQVFEESPRFRRNKRDRAATHQMIGPDRGRRLWTICIAEERWSQGIWRAITGWPAEPHEADWYRGQGT